MQRNSKKTLNIIFYCFNLVSNKTYVLNNISGPQNSSVVHKKLTEAMVKKKIRKTVKTLFSQTIWVICLLFVANPIFFVWGGPIIVLEEKKYVFQKHRIKIEYYVPQHLFYQYLNFKSPCSFLRLFLSPWNLHNMLFKRI